MAVEVDHKLSHGSRTTTHKEADTFEVREGHLFILDSRAEEMAVYRAETWMNAVIRND